MGCFVTKTRYGVHKRNCSEVSEVNIIMTVKLVDLDSFIHYHEIQFINRTQDHLFGDITTSSVNKRDTSDLAEHNDDPIMDDIEFTDLAMTDEMEGFLKLLGGEQNVDSSTM